MKIQCCYSVLIVFFFSIILSNSLSSQERTQTIRGFVQDKASKETLIGASIQLVDSNVVIGTITDFNGEFILRGIPTGRIRLRCDYLGYMSFVTPPFILNSAKEPFLEIAMEEVSVQLNEVVINAINVDHSAQNDMVLLSGRSFTAEETERYAGSIADPSRMAVSFAGVQASNDLDNDIVVRGNSSVGLLWRMEGIDIPNPNHFARRGSSGGGISIFSVNMLRNSDFIYGAPPAEYGNALSGIFDMKLRKGNRERKEHSFRAGLLGLDLVTEGPIKKGKSSYLTNFRYSTLGLLNDAGVHVVGENTDNSFADLAFHLYFPSANNKDIIQWWGIGGLSSEIHQPLSDINDWEEYDDLTFTNFKTRMGVTGATWTHIIDKKSYIKFKAAFMADHITHAKDTVDINFNHGFLLDERYNTTRLTGGVDYSNKINKEFRLKTGLSTNYQVYDLSYKEYDNFLKNTFQYIEENGSNQEIHSYIEGVWKSKSNISIVSGLHFLYSSLNDSKSLEPRIAASYQINPGSEISLAYGVYSQMIPLGTYFTQNANIDLSLMKSQQWIASYSRKIGKWHLLSIEAYYQKLSDIPVAINPNVHYWLLNDLVGYAHYELTSEGSGQNYGLDISIERSFDKGYFYLGSLSLYRSKYMIGEDNYSSRYDGKFNSSLAVGKEFEFDNGNSLQLGIRNLIYGGQWFTPADDEATKLTGEYHEDLSTNIRVQNKTYWRSDARVSFTKNTTALSWTIALDVQNMLNRENTRGEIWNFKNQQYESKLQAGIIPVISFQVDF